MVSSSEGFCLVGLFGAIFLWAAFDMVDVIVGKISVFEILEVWDMGCAKN